MRTIIDVRTPQEFSAGHITGSINIPLNEIQQRESEIQGFDQPIVLCCMSGGRSGQATQYLKQKGIECTNGGGWMELNHQLTMSSEQAL